MEENKNYELEDLQEQEEQSALDFQTIYSTLILNWKWFLLSIVLCCALAVAYVKLAPKVFQSSTKILIKDDESKKSGGAAGAAAAAGASAAGASAAGAGASAPGFRNS